MRSHVRASSKRDSSEQDEGRKRAKARANQSPQFPAAVQQTPFIPATVHAREIVHLQKALGNFDTARLLSRRTPAVQRTLDVSHPADADEIEADRAAGLVASGERAVVTSHHTAGRIARTAEAPSSFKGWAGEADVRASKASEEAGGLSPIKVDTKYTVEQAKRKEEQMDEFRKADIPFVYNNQDHYLYKQLIELRQQYLDDVTRISLAESAFNEFVVPGSLARKSAVQFKQVQVQLGYDDESDPTDDLSAKERLTLAKHLDAKTLRKLNADISNKQKLVNGKRTEILGTTHNIQAALQARKALLAKKDQEKAEKEQSEINEKIKAVSEGAEKVAKVIELVSFAGFGAPEAIESISAAGGAEAEGAVNLGESTAKAVKGGLELGSKGATMIGSTVEFIMSQVYKDDLQKVQQEIKIAQAAEAHAKQMDADLRYDGSMLTVQGQVEELAGAIGELALALEQRKDYFAKLGGDTDAATAGKGGNKISQYLEYVSQASETKTHIDSAKAFATTANDTMRNQIREMAKHRGESYGDSNAVWGGRNHVDPDGPDLEFLRATSEGLDGFIKSSDKELDVIDRVIGSLPAAK